MTQSLAVAGRWYFCDDGWMGELALAHVAEGSFEGTFYSDRFDAEYRATAHVAGPVGHEITVTIHDFNWLPEQRFTGYLFTSGNEALAGTSDWHGTPYGFFAARTPWAALGEYRSGTVRPDDFAGSWNAQLDGKAATVRLELDADGRTLRGSCEWPGLTGMPGAAAGAGEAEEYEVVAIPGAEVPHQVTLRIGLPGREPRAVLDGCLNSRPKNAISGSMALDQDRRGFYLIRYA